MRRAMRGSALTAVVGIVVAIVFPATATAANRTPSTLSVDPTRVVFGRVAVGTTVTSDVLIKNNGTDALVLVSTGFTRGEGFSTDYGPSTCYSAGLPAGGSCTLRFTYTPVAVGGDNSEATVNFRIADTTTYVASPPVRLRGTGK